ncbi:MAG: DUF2225 domain-containing protein [Clostridiales Family XIII bacterium]|jgi:uncharacterized protein (DUF2225 family)|nr:DUF2225 domain-containing protein [Clostridiales Family XIII bacterium]
MDISAILKLSGIKKFLKNQVITKEGDGSSDGMYIVLQGTVGTFKNYQKMNEAQLSTVTPGNFFGEMSLFLGKGRAATAVALSEVIALEINRANVLDIFSKQPEITYTLMQGLCRRIDELDTSNQFLHTEARKDISPAMLISAGSPLFPEAHGNYILPIDNTPSDFLFEDTVKCPICGHKFSNLTVLVSKLEQESKDDDHRIRYKGVEPLYYEAVSCPNCLYSAMVDLFKDIEVTKRMAESLRETMAPYLGNVEIRTGRERDTFTVFASYYLAILGAPQCFYEHQRITARLWRNLGRIYDDCSEERLMEYALQKSVDEYLYSYSHFDIEGKNMQQLCFVIGELKYQLGDLLKAREFLYAAMVNRDGNPVTKRLAEDRLETVKALLKEAEGQKP